MKADSNRSFPLVQCVAAFALFVFFVCWCRPAIAQVSSPQDELTQAEWQQGYHGLAMLCRSYGMDLSVSEQDFNQAHPEETLVICLGNNSEPGFDLSKFIEDGGALLVATDRETSSYVEPFGVMFSSGPARLANEAYGLNGLEDCPISQTLSRSHPTSDGVRRIATNRPGRLRLHSSFYQRPYFRSSITAWLPECAFPGRSGRNLPNPVLSVAIEAPESSGRVIMLADQSVLANQMLIYEDNARFAANTIGWLSQHEVYGRRQFVFLISDGKLTQPLDPGALDIQAPPVDPRDVLRALQNMPPAALLDFGNEVSTAVEDAGIANEVMSEIGQLLPMRAIWTLIIIAITIVMGVLVFRSVVFANTNDRSRSAQRSLWETAASKREQESYERFTAAHELLNEFRQWLESKSGQPLKLDMSSLVYRNDPARTRLMHQRLNEMRKKMSRFRAHEWSESRLSDLDVMIDSWKNAFEIGHLQILFD